MSDLNTMPDPYQFLGKISTEELRRLLREDFESSDESTPENDEFITKVMEVIAQREESASSTPTFDPAAGWEDFQKNYSPTEDDSSLPCDDARFEELTRKHRVVKSSHHASTPSPKRRIKPVALVAATIGVIMGLLVVAQAAGLDVFGAMARWTDDTFHFITTTSSNNEVVALRSKLEEQGFPVEYAPTWVPDGFIATEPQIVDSKRISQVSTYFTKGNSGFLFAVTRYRSQEDINATEYEKVRGDAIPYTNRTQCFYILENSTSTTATWFDGNLLTIDISGQLSTDDMKSIIDSMGG